MIVKRPNLTWVGVLLGVGYWLIESLLHAYVFGSGSLVETLYGEHDPNEIWMRLLIAGLLAAFGWGAERMVRAERHDKERAKRLNRLFSYVHLVASQVGGRHQSPAGNRMPGELSELENTLLDEDDIARIVHAVQELSKYLDSRIEELYAILELTHEINKGLLVDEVLGKIYESFRTVVPYDRIGVALLQHKGQVLTSRWVRSDYGESKIPLGYSAPMRGSSLERIIETGEPRIINDLEEYLSEHPESRSTRLILAEGIRSSLTCPLIASGKPVGFIFFSSRAPGAYREAHSEFFKLIAGQLSIVIEKSHIYEELIDEKETSEALLLNVMPARIIARMRAGNENPVEDLSNVGVLFIDLVGFTEVARCCSAESVVEFLRDVFTKFDFLCERHGVEKIKTIGDAYMVCSGAEGEEGERIAKLARFALDVVSTVEQTQYPDGRNLEVRIGVHAGPVIAGVIGQKKFAYDIWGETVNLAQRLEATSKPNRIHVSSTVYGALHEDYSFESRGEVELKGEGWMGTYFLTGKRGT